MPPKRQTVRVAKTVEPMPTTEAIMEKPPPAKKRKVTEEVEMLATSEVESTSKSTKRRPKKTTENELDPKPIAVARKGEAVMEKPPPANKRKVTKEVKEIIMKSKGESKSTKRGAKKTAENEPASEHVDTKPIAVTRKGKAKAMEGIQTEQLSEEQVKTAQKPKAKKKTESKDLQSVSSDETKQELDKKAIIGSLVLLPRHLKTKKYVGAHTSISGGLFKAIEEAEEIGAVSIGMFLRSQRTWKAKELDEKSIKLFKEKLQSSGMLPNMIIPHGSYLLNCGSADEGILGKTRECLIDELKRCELLGIPMYNFHPGSAKGSTDEKCISLIAETINLAHRETKCVITLVENMSRQGNTIGGDFNQLRSIIDQVKDKSRIGVCFDTCHAFAAGYDLRSEEGYERTKQEFDKIVGRRYLKAVHLNDSKGDLGCHLDRHENIGKGKLGLEFFRRLMNDPFFDGIALVLETPEGDYKREIDLLYDLCL